MSGRSSIGFFLPVDSASFGDYEPMSVARAWLVRNNLQYLIDEYPQHRINWVSGPIANLDSWQPPSGAAGLDSWWAATFLHTWIRPDVATNLDIKITARANTDDGRNVTVYARIVPDSAPLGGTAAAPVLWDASHTWAASTGAWDAPITVFDGVVQLLPPPNLAMANEWRRNISPGVAEDDGFVHLPLLTLARLEIKTLRDAHQQMVISSVLVREFA